MIAKAWPLPTAPAPQSGAGQSGGQPDPAGNTYPPEYAVVAHRGYVERINNGQRSLAEQNMIRQDCRRSPRCKVVIAEDWQTALRQVRGH